MITIYKISKSELDKNIFTIFPLSVSRDNFLFQIRQKILCSAFLRSLKDPFPPARQGGVLAMAATQNLYSLKEVATRLLPALCCMTMDTEKGVRDQVHQI